MVTNLSYQDNIVYSLKLSCNKIYIGQSGRCVNTRIDAHFKKSEKNDSKVERKAKKIGGWFRFVEQRAA